MNDNGNGFRNGIPNPRGGSPARFFPNTVDAGYFAPREAAYPHHSCG